MNSTSELTCEERRIPSHLHANNKSFIEDFESEEALYRWIRPEVQVSNDGKVSQATFTNDGRRKFSKKNLASAFDHTHQLSVNRSSLCDKPEDVLYNPNGPPHRFECGVLKTSVKEVYDVHIEYEDPRDKKLREITFSLKHDPEECMYPHSLIQAQENGLNHKNPLDPGDLRRVVRVAFSDIFVEIIKAGEYSV